MVTYTPAQIAIINTICSAPRKTAAEQAWIDKTCAIIRKQAGLQAPIVITTPPLNNSSTLLTKPAATTAQGSAPAAVEDSKTPVSIGEAASKGIDPQNIVVTPPTIALGTYIAINRFGFGGTYALAQKVQSVGARQWLLNQLNTQDPHRTLLSDMGKSDDMVKKTIAFNAASIANPGNPNPVDPVLGPLTAPGTLYAMQLQAYMDLLIKAEQPLRERMTLFWANHFTATLSAGYPSVLFPYMNEAIRPFVFGKFHDMLKAVSTHFMMLVFLNNNLNAVRTYGSAKKTYVDQINENHAREILELHTVGVNGGYDQTDIRELAYAMTGWTIDGKGVGYFNPALHAPVAFKPYVTLSIGGITKQYQNFDGPDGAKQFETILRDLATHPSTYKFLAIKLLNHFIPGGRNYGMNIGVVIDSLTKSGGDLGQAMRVILNMPESMDDSRRVFRQPIDWLISSLRHMGATAYPATEIGVPNNVLADLGQRLFDRPSPEGWSDRNEDWLTPEGVAKRIKLVMKLVTKTNMKDTKTIRDGLLQTMAPGMTTLTRNQINNADTNEKAIALSIMNPAFLWR